MSALTAAGESPAAVAFAVAVVVTWEGLGSLMAGKSQLHGGSLGSWSRHLHDGKQSSS